MRDAENNVSIDVVIAGEYSGDGKPKAVRFPDPATEALLGESIALLPLPRIIELKLASGMTAPQRMKDLADVRELIKATHLAREVADQLDASVREKYVELWKRRKSWIPSRRSDAELAQRLSHPHRGHEDSAPRQVDPRVPERGGPDSSAPELNPRQSGSRR